MRIGLHNNCHHPSIKTGKKVYIQTAFSVVPSPLSVVRFITPCVTHNIKSLHVLPNDAVPSVVLSKVTTLHELQERILSIEAWAMYT